MVEKEFNGVTYEATTRRVTTEQHGEPQDEMLFIVSAGGHEVYQFDPAIDPPQTESEAVEFAIELAQALESDSAQS